MDGGVAFARVANTALISICGELQWSYELLRSLCASTRRDAHYRYLNCLLNCRGKAVLARGRRYRVHVHMYTCTVCACGKRKAWRFTQTLSISPQRCWLCLDPGLNPITNDQTPVVPFCYRIINMLNCGTERHGESGVHRASVFSLASRHGRVTKTTVHSSTQQ